MSALFKKHLSRRTFIRGVGVTMSLPFLDAMVPARTASGADGGPAAGQAWPLLHPARRGDEPVDAGHDRRAGVVADSVAAGGAQGSGGRA